MCELYYERTTRLQYDKRRGQGRLQLAALTLHSASTIPSYNCVSSSNWVREIQTGRTGQNDGRAIYRENTKILDPK
jgi:hypothetical protein